MRKKNRFLLCLLGGLAAAALLAGCGSLPASTWTYLIYMDADNNLEAYAIGDFLELAKLGSNANVNVLVLFDRTPYGYSSAYDNWTDTRLFYLTRGMTPADDPLNDYVPLGTELNMADPQTLTDFIVYCQQNYPANHTILTLWDHGAGVWDKSSAGGSGIKGINKGICVDDTSGPDEMLSTAEVAQALTDAQELTGQRIELIDMDACLMQMLEIAYEWRNVTDYLVGSEASIPAYGNNYALALSTLEAYPWLTVRQYGAKLVDAFGLAYRDYGGSLNYAALSLGPEFTELMAVFREFAAALNGTRDANMGLVARAGHDATTFDASYMEFRDLWDLAAETTLHVPDAAVAAAARDLKAALTKAVYRYWGSGALADHARGISILLPTASQWNWYDPDQYAALAMSVDTDWDDVVLRYAAFTAP